MKGQAWSEPSRCSTGPGCLATAGCPEGIDACCCPSKPDCSAPPKPEADKACLSFKPSCKMFAIAWLASVRTGLCFKVEDSSEQYKCLKPHIASRVDTILTQMKSCGVIVELVSIITRPPVFISRSTTQCRQDRIERECSAELKFINCSWRLAKGLLAAQVH